MKKFVAYLLSIILIFPCLFLFSACEDEKILSKIAFYCGENRIVNNETFTYNYSEEISVLGSTLSVKAIYADNTTKTLASNEFSYVIIYSESGDFNNGTTVEDLPTPTSVGHFKITANYQNCSATIYINISKAEPEYFVTINKLNNKTIYYGDSANLFNFNLNTSDGTADTSGFTNLNYYVVNAATFASIPESESNKAKYILETSGMKYSQISALATLDVGEYYIFATFNNGDKTVYSTISNLSKFIINPKPIPVAEPIFASTTFDGNSHLLTINNLEYYTIVSGSLINTNAGTYTTVIKPKFDTNYIVDWNLKYFDASDYNYYTNFETFETDAKVGGITNLTANKTTGEITITWVITKANRNESICLGEYFDLRSSTEINKSIIPYSFNETYVFYRVSLYSEANKNLFLNSYTNSDFTISLINNTAEALLIKSNLSNSGSTTINVDITNSIYIAVPLENYFDGMAISYKIHTNKNENYNNAEFSGEITLNNISANFTSTNLAVGAGTTLESISILFSQLDGVDFKWYNVDELGNTDMSLGEVDLSTAINKNIKYALVTTYSDDAWNDDQLISILDQVLTENEVVFNFEVYAQEAILNDLHHYYYEKNNNSYKLSRFGKNITYITSLGETRYYKFIESATNSSFGYYEIYLASENENSTSDKTGIITQGQLSHFVNLFLTEFNANNGQISAIA